MNVEKMSATIGIGDVETHRKSAVIGSDALLRALILYALRRNQTLPGMSAGQTRALAINRGVAW